LRGARCSAGGVVAPPRARRPASVCAPQALDSVSMPRTCERRTWSSVVFLSSCAAKAPGVAVVCSFESLDEAVFESLDEAVESGESLKREKRRRI